MLPYAIVGFTGTDDVSIIPTSWFTGPEEDKCYWPPKPTNPMRINKMIITMSGPEKTTWEKHDVRVFGKAKDLERARQKALMAEETSNVETENDETEKPRKRRKNSKFVSDSSSESGEGNTDEVVEEFEVPPPPPGLSLASPQVSPSPATPPTRPSASTSGSTDQCIQLVCQDTPVRLPTMTPEIQPVRTCERTPTQQKTSSAPATNDVILKRVLALLEGIKQTQAIHGAQLQLLMKQADVQETAINFELPEGITFPIQTKEELEGFDLRLEQDKAFFKGLVIMLGDKGGRNLEEMVKRVMAHVMSDNFALQCNISGRNKKTGFGQARMFDVIYRAVKRNSQTCSSSRKDVELAVAKWLIGSRDRIGGTRRGRLHRHNSVVEEEV